MLLFIGADVVYLLMPLSLDASGRMIHSFIAADILHVLHILVHNAGTGVHTSVCTKTRHFDFNKGGAVGKKSNLFELSRPQSLLLRAPAVSFKSLRVLESKITSF